MLSQHRVITPPTAPVVDLDTLCRHGRIDSDAERDLMALYCGAATSSVEKYLGRALMPQTHSWTISEAVSNAIFPGGLLNYQPIALEGIRRNGGSAFELPYAPVTSVLSVTTAEWGAADVTLVAGTDYVVDLSLDPARIRLSLGWSWGTYRSLTARYIAGYANAAAIPQPIIHAVMMMALNLYEHRGDTADGGMSTAVRSLLTPFRMVTLYG